MQKFRNRKESLDGYVFASQLEAALYLILKDRQKNLEIHSLKCQETIYLTNARIIYKPDFSFVVASTDRATYAESKGFETPEWRIKRRLWKFYGPGPLEIWMGNHKKPFLKETIIPG